MNYVCTWVGFRVGIHIIVSQLSLILAGGAGEVWKFYQALLPVQPEKFSGEPAEAWHHIGPFLTV